ncbi:uncharacterized protein LOC131317518 [Rhododendron vialii]|uniref:uncharacterized protein LOC131317518 n=1 Tax=Rhododendron vialii TaxID=182163 RepID=UPI00265E8D6B|nr:uncharacterized protein LOC131317518 [Rhododendron vialii]
MVDVDPVTPLIQKNQAEGKGDKSPSGAPIKPTSGHGKRTTSRDRPLTIQDDSKNKEGRTATGSTRRSKSHRREDSVAHSRSVHNNENSLDNKRQKIKEYARLIKKREHEIRQLERIREHPEDSGLSRGHSRGDKGAMVKYKVAPSHGRSRSRGLSPKQKRASSRKRRSMSPSRQRFSPRKWRSRSRSSSPNDGTRKHHRDKYERPEFDWNGAGAHKTKEQEDGTMSAREAARQALSNIAASPFARRLQGCTTAEQSEARCVHPLRDECRPRCSHTSLPSGYVHACWG